MNRELKKDYEIGQKIIDESNNMGNVTTGNSYRDSCISGKSEFVDYIVTKLNIKHGWKAAFFTPENYPLKFHYAKLFEKMIGKKFSQI